MAKYDVFKALMAGGSWDDFINYSRFNYYNNRYSLFNCGLILLQRPGATTVQSEARWRELNREIKPQAIPIVILQPDGPVTLVYDYSDTYGENSTELYSKESIEKYYGERYMQTVTDKMFYRILHKLTLSGIDYEERAYGDRMGGNISAHEYPNKLYCEKRTRQGIKRVEIDSYYTISVNSSNSIHQKFLTILHELGHLYCGHIYGGKRTAENKAPESDRSGLPEDTKEYEAELVCRILCDRYCYANLESDEYLQQHTHNGKLPPIGLTEVITAADRITERLALR